MNIFCRRKLLLLEVIIAVLSPLFEEESLQMEKDKDSDQDPRERETLNDRTDSEISIFLVCAEMRVAFSMCQYFSKLPALLVSENK